MLRAKSARRQEVDHTTVITWSLLLYPTYVIVNSYRCFVVLYGLLLTPLRVLLIWLFSRELPLLALRYFYASLRYDAAAMLPYYAAAASLLCFTSCIYAPRHAIISLALC